jgi:hypothetical protein
MLKNLTAIIAGTLIALGTGPAFAQSQNVPVGLDALMNLLEPKTIFVTSTDHDGDLGGLAGADIICQDLADAPGSIVPEGEYVALLSTDDVNASERITPSTGPYIRPDGAPVAANFAALFSTRFVSSDHNLINRPFIDETGMFRDVSVWTGTSPRGTATSGNCLGWTSSEELDGDGGLSDSSLGTWLEFPPDIADCVASLHLYCVLR